MTPFSAVPVYFDLPRMSALCRGLGEPPPLRPTPYAGWEGFCSWATLQADARRWRDALVSFVRWQGARDDTFVDLLRERRAATGGLRRAWLTALSRADGALFAGWVDMGRVADRPFTDLSGRRRRYVTLCDTTRAFSAVLSGPGLLDDVQAPGRRLRATPFDAPAPMLLVGRMDRARMITPYLAAIGCG